jgi:dolichol kinase
MPTLGDDVRERSPHPYARRGRASEESNSYDARHTPTTMSSESGTEADDERPRQFLRALPPPVVRPAKGLRQDGDIATPLLTPSQLDSCLSEGYFEHRPTQQARGQAEQDELAVARRLFEKRRRAERIRRISEGALLVVIGLTVTLAPSVTSALWKWHTDHLVVSHVRHSSFAVEIASQMAIVILLVAVYPVRIVIFYPDNDTSRPRWRRFRVPASFDPASVIYPTFIPVLVALSLLPQFPALLLPNLILGLASLPPRLFPPSSRLKDINTLHWLVTITPLIFSDHAKLPLRVPPLFLPHTSQASFLQPELLTLLYPLHQALLPALHYLTTTSLLATEKHLLSAALINLLLFATSPQMSILRALLWIGGVCLLVLCTHVVRWNVALARVPRWRFRRFGQEKRSLNILKRCLSLFTRYNSDDSDPDDPASFRHSRPLIHKRPKLGLSTTFNGLDINGPKSANFENHQTSIADPNDLARKRRHTITGTDVPASLFGTNTPRRQRRLRDWHLDLTPEGAFMYKWAYAAYIFAAILFVVLIPVRMMISDDALDHAEPIIWAFDYLFSDMPTLFDALSCRVGRIAYQDEILQNLSIKGSSVPGVRVAVGAANTRLLIVAYWLAVLCIGLVAVLRLTPFIEVDTRRKVFHAVMVTMLLPSIFVDPCFSSLALGLVLAVFLILEIIRAGQVPPLGLSIGKFVAPYVDGRDLRGPMVVSHVFLLIGCAIPLWLSLAGLGRTTSGRWPGWETQNESREVAMVAGVVCVGMGDAAASLIGRRFGRCKWPWIGGKSLEGSAAFAVAVTIGLLVAKSWVRFGGWPEVHARQAPRPFDVGFWGVEVTKMFLCGCGASFMEAVLTGANDNVVVPVALWLLVKSLGV